MNVLKPLTVLSLLLLFADPAPAALFGLVQPDVPGVEDPETQSLTVTLGLINPFAAQGNALERPQSFTALRHEGGNVERSEHLSVLEQTQNLGAPAWSARIALPQAGVYQFIMETKPVWMPEQDRFVQHFSKVQVPVRVSSAGSPESWDKPSGDRFEIVPLTRPFGLCTGMNFRGQVLLNGKPLPGAVIEVARLNDAVKPDSVRVAPSVYHEAQVLKTEERGLFNFTCPQPGWWGFAALSSGDPLQDPDAQLKPLEIRAEFWVWMDPCKERIVKRKP